MNRIRTVLMASAVAALLTAACSDDSQPATPVPTPVLMPLAVGNEWVYTLTVHSYSIFDTTYTFRIYRTKTDSLGRTCYSPLENDTTSDEILATQWWVNTDRGFEIFGSGIDDIVYKYPADSGQYYRPSTESSSFFMVVSYTDTLITVPAGTFSCYRYDYYDENYNILETDCFSPGVGLIFRAIVYTDRPEVSLLTLDSYTLH